MTILLLACVVILSIDRDTLFFVVKVAPPAAGKLFGSPAEQAYLVLGFLIGMAAGPMQAASRTLLIRLAPPDRITQFFGLFALSGKVTSFMAPLAVSIVTAVTASQKAGMAMLVLFFAAGLALLSRVRGVIKAAGSHLSPLIPAEAGIQFFFLALGPRFRGDERMIATQALRHFNA